MPFGVYKGKKMANVPASYLKWIYDNNKNLIAFLILKVLLIAGLLIYLLITGCDHNYQYDEDQNNNTVTINYDVLTEKILNSINYRNLINDFNINDYEIIGYYFYNNWRNDTISRKLDADKMTNNIISGLWYDSLAKHLSKYMPIYYDSIALYMLQQTDSIGKVQINLSIYYRFDTLVKINNIANNPIILNYDIDKNKIDSIFNKIIQK